MRRRFQLATVFTGVAAVAGGAGATAFGGTAQADVNRPASVHNQICGANNGGVSKWFHVFYPNNDHPAECFHSVGVHTEKGIIHSFCGGTYTGEIFGHLTTTGYYYHRGFGPGTTRATFSSGRGNFSLSEVALSGWSGNDKCLG
jgi:hypothetical protein